VEFPAAVPELSGCRPQVTTTGSSFPAFDIDSSFVGDQTVLVLRGELDIHSAPDLSGYLDALINQGHVNITLDLAELDFLDSSGLSVMAGETIRLKLSGGSLIIQDPTVQVGHLLDVTGFSRMVSVEELQPVTGDLGRLGPEEPESPASAARVHELAQQLRMVTSIPSNDEVIDGALRLVVTLARATVGGADGVSVSLRRRGHLSTVAASDRTITDMDAGQYATGEGPCVDASVEGRWFHAESLDQESRWPEFVPKAQALGINSILSSPLMAHDVPVGALNIYSRTTAAFAPKDQELASIFASEASTILGDAGLDTTEEQLASKLAEVLRTRQVIAQAQGILMERDGVGEHDAYTALRRFSVEHGSPLSQRAQAIVESARRPPAAPDGRPQTEGHA
jgi:anti-anti-sigma factor